jgi:hypothetical protein
MSENGGGAGLAVVSALVVAALLALLVYWSGIWRALPR